MADIRARRPSDDRRKKSSIRPANIKERIRTRLGKTGRKVADTAKRLTKGPGGAAGAVSAISPALMNRALLTRTAQILQRRDHAALFLKRIKRGVGSMEENFAGLDEAVKAGKKAGRKMFIERGKGGESMRIHRSPRPESKLDEGTSKLQERTVEVRRSGEKFKNVQPSQMMEDHRLGQQASDSFASLKRVLERRIERDLAKVKKVKKGKKGKRKK